MSSIFRPCLFILFSFNFLQNCRSSADFHLLGVQDLTKNTREGEDKPPFCGRALRGAMAEEAVLPFEVLENVKQLNGPVMELELQLRVLLKSCRRQSLSLLTPVERASTFLCLSKALTTLFSFHLRTSGICPEKHAAHSEVERVSLYHDKVMKALDQSKGALQPTSAIDVGAANRFIEHAIPDLSADQKRRMWEVSKIQNQKQNHRKRSGGGSTIAPDLGPKLKRQSVAEDAADFLIEASKELLVIQQNQVLEDPL